MIDQPAVSALSDLALRLVDYLDEWMSEQAWTQFDDARADRLVAPPHLYRAIFELRDRVDAVRHLLGLGAELARTNIPLLALSLVDLQEATGKFAAQLAREAIVAAAGRAPVIGLAPDAQDRVAGAPEAA